MAAISASAPLCVPCTYDLNLRVDVCLNEPLHDQIILSEFFLADFLTRLTYLDITLRKHIQLSRAQEAVKRKLRVSVGTQLSQAEEVAKQLSDMVAELGLAAADPLKTFVAEMDMENMMPNAVEYINSDCAMPARLRTSGIDYYLTEISSLHQACSLSSLIGQDIAMGHNHKYIVHQMVMLYQLIKQFGDDYSPFRQSVEENFEALKAACSATDPQSPRIPEDLATWLTELTTLLETASLNLSDQCERFPHMQLIYQTFETE